MADYIDELIVEQQIEQAKADDEAIGINVEPDEADVGVDVDVDVAEVDIDVFKDQDYGKTFETFLVPIFNNFEIDNSVKLILGQLFNQTMSIEFRKSMQVNMTHTV